MKKFSALVLTVTVLLSLVSGFTFAAPAEPQTEPPAATSEPFLSADPADPAGPTDAQASAEPSADPSAAEAPGGAPEPDVQPAEPDYGIMTVANEAEVDPGSPNITLKLNGENYDPENNHEYTIGDNVDLQFNWPGTGDYVPNGPLGTVEVDLGNFEISSQINKQRGTIYYSGGTAGEWEVVDDKLILTFSPEFQNSSNRTFYVELEGTIAPGPGETADGEEHDIVIAGQTYNMVMKDNSGSFSASKSMSDVTYDETSGRYVSHVSVYVNANNVENIQLHDVMGNGLSYVDGSIQFPDGVTGTFEPSAAGDGYDLNIPGPFTGWNGFTVSYDVEVSADAMKTPGGVTQDALSNTLSGTYDQIGGDPDQPMTPSSSSAKITPPDLDKAGEMNGDAIEWTVTFNTGSYGQLTEQQILALGLGDLTFQDTLGPYQDLKDSVDLDSLTLNDFTGSPSAKGDGSWDYVFTYTVDITADALEYTNNVTTDFLGTTLTGTGSVGVGPTITKEFTEETADHSAMKWKVTVDIPDDDFTSITITDTPSNGSGTEKQSYSHQYVNGSLKIDDVDVSTLLGEGITLTGSFGQWAPGFTLVIDGAGSFAQTHKGQTITLTYETKAVTADGSSDGSLTGSYSWVNSVTEDLLVGTTTLSNHSGDTHERNSSLSLNKRSDGINADGIATWSVIVSDSNPLVVHQSGSSTFTGALFDPAGYTVQLHDVPDGSTYVEGSAYATLTGCEWNEQIREAFSKGLQVTVNTDGSFDIFWTANAGDIQAALMEQALWSALSSNLVISYQTKLTSDVLLDHLTDKNVTSGNQVTGTVNGEAADPGYATGNGWLGSDLEKQLIYRDGMDNDYPSKYAVSNGSKYNARFEVVINPKGILFTGDPSGHLTLEDTMGSSYKLILSSVALYNRASDPGLTSPLPSSEYTVNYDTSANKLFIRVPDGIALTLVYYASVIEPLGDSPEDASNSIKLTGDWGTLTSNSNTFSMVIGPRAGASSTDLYFTVLKYATDPTAGTLPLEGAEFELQKLLCSDGTFTPVGDPIVGTHPVDGTQTSFTISADDASVYVFSLQETKAPSGYTLSGDPYYFYFEDQYSGETSFPAGVTVEGIESGALHYVENALSEEFGDLTVSKTVVDDSGEEITADTTVFTFTVILSDDTVTGSYGDMDFTDGVATVTLKTGESATALDLPAGINYTVEETEVENYTPTEDVLTGAITADTVSTAAFVNQFTKPSEFGSLTVSKTVVDDSGEEITADTTVFTFTVTLSDDTVTGTYGDMDFTDGVATVTLKTGESATALDLPAGINYTVEETEVENYTPTEDVLTGAITADTVSTAAFVNQFTKPSEFGDLTVSKTVVDDSGEEITADTTVFTFTVTLSDDTVTGTYGDMDFTDGVATVTLKTGESATALDLPAGITYTVEETENDDYSSESTGATGSITANDTAEAHFTNTKKQTTQPSDTPAPTDTVAPTSTPAPTNTAAPSDTPAPTDTAAPSDTPAPSDTTAPSDTPVPTDMMEAETTPNVTATPAPTATAKPVSSDSPSTPDTGDDGQAGLWLAVLAASLTGLGLAAVTAVRRGKHNR